MCREQLWMAYNGEALDGATSHTLIALPSTLLYSKLCCASRGPAKGPGTLLQVWSHSCVQRRLSNLPGTALGET